MQTKYENKAKATKRTPTERPPFFGGHQAKQYRTQDGRPVWFFRSSHNSTVPDGHLYVGHQVYDADGRPVAGMAFERIDPA